MADEVKEEVKQEVKKDISFPALEKAEELLQKLELRQKEIQEKEDILDRKMKAFDQAQAEARFAGHGQMRVEISEEQKKDAAARALLKGTGFERYMP